MLQKICCLIFSILLCSCSSLDKFGKVETFSYKEFRVKDGVSETLESSFQFVKNSKSDCFSNHVNDGADVFTVKAEDFEKAISYFYLNKKVTSWDVKKVDIGSNRFKIIAYPETQITYEREHCYFELAGFHSNAYQYYTSFKIIPQKALIGEK